MSSSITSTAGLQGWYKIEAVRPDGSRKVLADWFPNIITDIGLNYVGSVVTDTGVNSLQFCRVGTGNSAPSVLDTALDTQIASSQTLQVTDTTAQGSAPFYISQINTYRFATGVAAGNLSEVGIGWTSSGATLFSRALILDGGGAPTTITVLSDEVLDVSYQFRIIPPTADVVGIITISAVNYNYTLRACNVTSTSPSQGWGLTSAGFNAVMTTSSASQRAFSGSIGAVTTFPAGTATNVHTGVTTDAYVSMSFERRGNLNVGLTAGNLAGGIKSIAYTFRVCAYQIEFTPAIPKDATKTLTLKFEHSWVRAVIP